MLYAYHGYFSCLSLVIFCALLDITNSSNRFRIEVDKYDPNAVDAHRRSLHHVFMEAAAALNFRDDIVKRDRASASTIHEVVFTVKQSNMEELTRILQDVSDPASDNYGRYKTFQEIADLTSNPQSQNVIVDYLQSAGAKVISQSLSGEFITARAPVHLWEGIFHTEFYVFHHVRSEDAAVQKVVRAGEYSIPSYLHKHVSSVLNTIQMPVAVWGNPVIEPVGNTSNPIQASAVDASHVTCAKLNQLYNIDNNIGSAQSTQAVFGALKQTFSPSDIALFQKFSNLPLQPVQTIIGTQSSETQCMNDHNSCAEASLDLQYIQGIAQISPTTFWYTNDFFTGWLLTVANTANPPLVLSISYGCNENLLSASEFENFNTQAIKLGVMGVTILAASGDDGASGYTSRYNMNKCGYSPFFPATSPYVTSVGATQGLERGTDEVTCQSDRGGIITTGGGFSIYYVQPSWQTIAVNNYFSTVQGTMEEPVRGFNALGRGYPDISAAGSSYVVYIGGTILSVSGTSASCPVIAGMITLINSARLLAGKKPVGFINPTLYATSNLFAKDITSGKNNCAVGSSGPTCCTQGFYAKPGWDPATGLGSVNFESLKRVFLNIGLAEAPTSPTLSPLRLAQSSSLTPTKLPSNLFADINTSPPPTTSSSGTGNVASPPQANVLTSSPSGTSTSISSSSQENFGFFNIKRTTPPPTLSPTHSPTRDPTKSPTKHPTKLPTRYPTRSPKSVPHKTRKSVRTRSPTPVKSSASSDNSCAAY